MADRDALEAVAEALWRHAGFGHAPGETVFAERPEWARGPYLAEARAVVAASDAIDLYAETLPEHNDHDIAKAAAMREVADAADARARPVPEGLTPEEMLILYDASNHSPDAKGPEDHWSGLPRVRAKVAKLLREAEAR